MSHKGNGYLIVLVLFLAMTSCGPENSEQVQAPLSEEELIRVMHDSRTDYYNNKDIASLMNKGKQRKHINYVLFDILLFFYICSVCVMF